MAKYDYVKIREIIERYCVDELELDSQIARDIAFHMTDWTTDLEELVEFYEKPDEFSGNQLDFLFSFLVHVPNHLAAASKLLTGITITDVFGVGVIDTDEKK